MLSSSIFDTSVETGAGWFLDKHPWHYIVLSFYTLFLPAGETVSLASLPIDIIEASQGREVQSKLSVASLCALCTDCCSQNKDNT